MQSKYRFLFAGGGTGGHLFPGIAVARKLKELKPDSRIMFIGTKNGLESRVVPDSGFDFKTIWISGIQRKINLKNILFPFKLLIAMLQSVMICIKFKPVVAIGTGAYVSGPAVWGASVMGAKIMLLEQNSYPGLTNRLLEKRAEEIHISFRDSEKYFRNKEKLKLTGNPIHVSSEKMPLEESLKVFGLHRGKFTILVLGGSLGARSINQAFSKIISDIEKNEKIQVLWQTGKNYYNEYKVYSSDNVKIMPFIDNMDAAYSSADLVIARAGATTIAEVAALSLPVIFIPSPHVAEDHQYKNAESIEKVGGCIVIKDADINERLYLTIMELYNNRTKLDDLAANIKKFSKPDAAVMIAKRAIVLAEAI